LECSISPELSEALVRW